jgi:hypothetical protein
MLDGEASAAPAPKNAAVVARIEIAIDFVERFTSTRPFTAGDMLSTLTVIPSSHRAAQKITLRSRLRAKGKESLSELGEFADES